MFSGCSSLLNIIQIYNFNVSKRNNIIHIFNDCSSLSDIKVFLQNLNLLEYNDNCLKSPL